MMESFLWTEDFLVNSGALCIFEGVYYLQVFLSVSKRNVRKYRANYIVSFFIYFIVQKLDMGHTCCLKYNTWKQKHPLQLSKVAKIWYSNTCYMTFYPYSPILFSLEDAEGIWNILPPYFALIRTAKKHSDDKSSKVKKLFE